MKLYYAPGTVSIAVAIALHEAGLDFDAQKVSFKDAEQTKPEYHAINPKGRVPALEVDGRVLTETGAILDYIAAVAPDTGLMPEAPLDAARVRGVMHYLASTVQPNHAHGPRAYRWAEKEESHADMRAQVPKTMAASATYIEDHCLKGPYVMGDHVTVADPHLFVMCLWLKGDGVDVDGYPLITAFMAAMEERESVKAVRAAGML
ncbi:glutathione S-transferase [Roseovarius nanhaiticus]|uniref:Glutathione S-transferase n=1 Tax=Roseovarius nanhaiticus TaxID=573024 RepID=A0A1N7EG88_9RHOB|nr:glutathione S-transferase family protein [Roseovarius nanhaiticus]SEK75202.1 glutathione S-transferase [Roseovarius nanhaiticus]SIR87097.1 glutathione S-transferase [Roseovarius nanhaiticus]